MISHKSFHFQKRRRPKVEYISDGRKVIDGVIEDEQQPNALWTTTISRGVAHDWRERAEGGPFYRAKQYGRVYELFINILVIPPFHPTASSKEAKTSHLGLQHNSLFFEHIAAWRFNPFSFATIVTYDMKALVQRSVRNYGTIILLIINFCLGITIFRLFKIL
ncbi:hypothetical protein COOONC_27705 [Cooperia oncophora]